MAARLALCAIILFSIGMACHADFLFGTGTGSGILQSAGATLTIEANGRTSSARTIGRQGNFANVPNANWISLSQALGDARSYTIDLTFDLRGANVNSFVITFKFASCGRVSRVVLNNNELAYLLKGTPDILQTFQVSYATGLNSGKNTLSIHVPRCDSGDTVVAFSMWRTPIPSFASTKCGLFPTGVGANGHMLNKGKQVSYWTFYRVDGDVNRAITPVVNQQLAKLAPIPGAQYISHKVADFSLPRSACFRYTTYVDFSKKGCNKDYKKATIIVNTGVDDGLLRCAVNGRVVSCPKGGYSYVSSFRLTGFKAGKNKLEFDICNRGGGESCAVFSFDIK